MPVRICVISDIRIHRDGLNAALTPLDGIAVVGVFGGDDDTPSRIAALSPPPEVILFDLSVKDRMALVTATHRAVPAARLVALGVDDFEPEIVACAEAGMSGFLSREATIDELAGVITSVVRNELVCSPSVAAKLFRRVAVSATVAPAGALAVLTAREREVLALIREGLANKEIAGQLQIAEATVKNHVHHLLEKLQVKRRIQAARVPVSAMLLRAHQRLNHTA
jgi:two-component system, NarL family, nitrate/nitrite response regulator NarL